MKKANLMLIIGLMMVLSLGLVSAQTCDFEIDRHSDSVMFIPGTPGGVNNEYTVNCLVSSCDNITVTNNVLVNEAVNGVASEYASGSTSQWVGSAEFVNDGNIYTFHTMYNNPAWQIDFASPKEIVGGKVLFDYILDSTYAFNQYEVRALVDGSWELIYSSAKNDTNDWHVFMHDDVVVTSSLRLRFDLGGEWHNNKIKLFQWEVLSKDLILENAGSPHLVDVPGMGSNTDYLGLLLSTEPMYYNKQVYFDSIETLKNYALVDTVSNGICSFNSVWSINSELYGDNVLNENTGVYYTNIQDAIDAASSGDTLRLSAMTYYENLVIEKPISLIGEGPGQTVIKGVIRDDSIIRVVGEDGNRLSGVRIEGMTLDHQSMGNVAQFAGVSGVFAVHVSDLTVRNVHMINFGEPGNFVYERGGLSISSADNVLLEDIVVDNVYGKFTRGARIQNAENVVTNNFVATNFHGQNANDWLFYLSSVVNSSFTNSHFENYTGHGTSDIPLIVQLMSSHNNEFKDLTIKNVAGYNSVGIRMQYSDHNYFEDVLIDGLEAGLIASAIDMTHNDAVLGGMGNNEFHNIIIRNVEGDIQTRAINLDRGANNNYFKNVLIENLKGNANGVTAFTVMGIQINARDPNGDTINNLFEDVIIRNLTSSGQVNGVGISSLANNAVATNNNFINLTLIRTEDESDTVNYGFQERGDGGNSIIGGTISGWENAIHVAEGIMMPVIENNTFSNNKYHVFGHTDCGAVVNNNEFDFYLIIPCSSKIIYGDMRGGVNPDVFEFITPQQAKTKNNTKLQKNIQSKINQVFIPENTILTAEAGDIETGLNFEAVKITDIFGSFHEVNGKMPLSVVTFGMNGHNINLSNPVNISIHTGFNGETMHVLRSVDGVTWTTEGLVSDECVVANNVCSFQTTKASYFAVMYDETSTGTTSGRTRYLPDGSVYGSDQTSQVVAPQASRAPLFALGGDIGDWSVPWYFWALLGVFFLFLLLRKTEKKGIRRKRR